MFIKLDYMIRMTLLGGFSILVVTTQVVAEESQAQRNQPARAVELTADWDATEASLGQFADRSKQLTEAEIEAQQAGNEIAIARANGRASVLVYFESAAARGVDLRPMIREFATQRQGTVKYEYNTVLPNVMNLRNIPAGDVEALRQMPGVTKVELDEYHPNLVRLHDSTPLIRGLQSQISSAGLSADGAGVRICVVDTGIDTDHIMYSDRIDLASSYDFNNGDPDPEDDHGHGSHVAGIAAGGVGLSVDFGCGAGSQPFQGVAPAATLISAKVLNASGGGFTSNIIAGIDHCADQSPSGGRADVINMSIGTGNFAGICTHSWAVAANNAVANGVVAVAASGNENNSNSMGSPACGVDVIAVGATYKADYPTCEDNLSSIGWGDCNDLAPINEDDVVCFSNESDFLDVSAPGAIIWSASNAAGGGSIVGQAGTSMASPQVAGLAALILDVDPSLTPTEVRQIIRDGAIDMGPAGFDRAYGFGRIDVINTLQLVGGGGCSGDPECDDGIFCNGAETCVAGACQPGAPVDCDDGVGCTNDSCNEGTDSCDHVAVNGHCDDGQFCNGTEICDPVLDCQAGTAVNCDDGVSCTNDSCNEGTDSCDNMPSNGLCDDGQFCNGSETCDPVFDCQSGTPVNCDDGVDCTDDSCNEGTDLCDNTPNNAQCDNGVFCDGAETCHPTLDCQSGSDPCPGQVCDEGNDECIDCQNNGDCDDGVFCNGAETCLGGTCQAGTPVNCDDGVSCTADACNEGTDSCDNVPNDAGCDNGQYCDGSETCDPVFDCQSGTAVDCDDGVGCTVDSCNEGTDACDNTPNHGACDNGVFCDGAEVCDSVLDCQSGGDPCPGQLCDESGDVCVDCFDNGDCDDGQFCNGTETCVGGSCVGGGDPCPGQSCNESTDMCESVDCIDNGDCDDGNACTVDTCDSGSCTNACPGAIGAFPYSEDFEAGLGAWTNVGGDDFDWTRDANGTPSSSTGPSGDHTTGSGFYMYTETSSPRVQGDTAILEGPCIDLSLSSTADVSFWYHMYGSTMGTLNVEVSDDCTSWTNVWSLSGNQGNSWFEASINLDAYSGSVIRVRFVGIRGSSYTGDIAIDDIIIDAAGTPCSSDPECDDGDSCTIDACVGNVCQNAPIDCNDGSACTIDSCSGGVCTNECPVTVGSFPDAEDYEAGTGDWSNSSDDDIDWTRNSGGTPSSGTGPSGDHTTGSGWYMYIEASSPNYPSMTAILDGPCVDLNGSSSAGLSFWYHMLGSSVGTLFVEASTDCTSWATVWSLSGNQGSAWQQADVDLSAYAGSTVSIRFRGVTGSSWQGDICIDDVQFDATGGPECTVDPECDDGLYCNGVETCNAGSCQAGTPIDCDDGVSCTIDSCNEGTDSCDNTSNDAACDDGAFCNGSESCDPVFDCQAGSPVDCDDGVDCTIDTCNEGTDSCDNTPDDGACADGQFCNGVESCHPTLDCQAGSDPCDDGVGCTDDSCDEGGDTCNNVPNDTLCDDGQFCNGAETCDRVQDCQAGSDPCPGQGCDEGADECLSGPTAQLEADVIVVGGSPVTVPLIHSYVNPVVVCSVQYDNNATPVVARVRNVTGTSFDVRLQNPSDGAVAAENVYFLVVEEGTWTIDGVNIEAQSYMSTVTDENNSWVAEAQSYNQGYSNPVVLGQVMSENDADCSVFWEQGNARANPPSASSLRTGKTVCEDSDTTRADELIGFVVIESGHGTLGGVEYEAALGANSIQGVTNSPPDLYTFNSAFAGSPGVTIVTMAGVNGANGGWAQLHGPTAATSTNLFLSIDEDQVADSERNHVAEQVGYLVFESALVYP